MVFIVKMTKEDLQKIKDKFVFKDMDDESVIKKKLGGDYSDIEVLKIAD